MKLKTWQKNVLSAIIIVVVGLVLFNVAFLLAALVSLVFGMIVKQVFGGSIGPMGWKCAWLILVLLITWLVFRSKLNDLVKATFMTMPLAVILAVVGIYFYAMPVLVYVIGAMIIAAILFYLHKKKRSWLYYFATVYVAVVMLYVELSGMQI